MLKTKKAFSLVLTVAMVVGTFCFSSINVSAADTYYINSDFTGATVGTYSWWRDYANPLCQTYVDEGTNRVAKISNVQTDVSAARGQFMFQTPTAGTYNGTLYTKGISIVEMNVKIDGAAIASREFFGNLFAIQYNNTDQKYYLNLIANTGFKNIVAFPTGVWKTIKIIFDSQNNKYLAVYVGGVQMNTYVDGTAIGTPTINTVTDYTASNVVRNYQKPVSTIVGSAYLYIDDVKFYKPGTLTVSSVTPANNAVNVAANSQMNVTFGNDMDANTFTSENLIIENADTCARTTGNVYAYNSATKTVTITPSATLLNESNYNIRITPNVKDIYGQGLAADAVYTFRTVIGNAASIQSMNFYSGMATSGTPITAIQNGSITSKIEAKNITSVTKSISVIVALVKKVGTIESFEGYSTSTMTVPTEVTGTFINTLTVPTAEGGAEYFLRAYFWDTLDGMNAVESTRKFGSNGLIVEQN